MSKAVRKGQQPQWHTKIVRGAASSDTHTQSDCSKMESRTAVANCGGEYNSELILIRPVPPDDYSYDIYCTPHQS